MARWFEAMAYLIKILIQLSPYVYSRSRSFTSTVAVTSTISFIAGSSAALTSSLNWGGVCEDRFGVRTPATQIGEWISCVPLIIFMVISVDNKQRMSTRDFMKIVFITIAMVLYSSLQLNWSIIVSGILLVLTNISFFVSLWLLIADSNWFSFRKGTVVSDGNDIQHLLRNRLTKLLTVFMPLFPLVYYLSAAKVLDHDNTAFAFILANLSTKLMFSVVAYDASVEVLARTLFDETNANESRRALLDYIMQEARGPLHALTLGVELLSSDKSYQQVEGESLVMMQVASLRMGEVLNDVIDMHNMEARKFRLIYAPFAIRDVVQSVEISLSSLIQSRACRLMTSLSNSVPGQVVGDRARVERVLYTVLGNAVKASPKEGTVRVSFVVVNSSAPDKSSQRVAVQFSVTDYGAGLSEDEVKALFLPFSQISLEQHIAGGSIVGLSICKKVIEMHDGTLTVTSVLGTGSTYTFVIPFDICVAPREDEVTLTVAADVPRSLELVGLSNVSSSRRLKRFQAAREESADVADTEDEEHANLLDGHGSSLGAQRVLVVDGSEAERDYLLVQLKKERVSAAAMEDGVAAIDEMTGRLHRFDVVFLSVELPLMSGLETTRQLRRMGYSRLILGLVDRGKRNALDVAGLLESGMDCVLEKPVRAHTLLAVLKHIERHGCVTGSSDMSHIL